MDIQHTQPQANHITASPIRFTDHASSEMVSTAYNLHQQENISNCLRLTHKIVDTQIDELAQEISFFLDNLQEQLNTLKNAGVFQNNEAPMKTIASHVAIALVDINKAATLKHNLEILKQRDFKPIKEGALTLVSPQALGGAGGRNITEESKQRIENLKLKKKELERKIKRWEADCKQSREKLTGFIARVNAHESNMSEILRTEGSWPRQQYLWANKEDIDDAKLCVAMQEVENNRGHQQLQLFKLDLESVNGQLETETRLLHPDSSSSDVGCSSRIWRR